MDIVFVNTHPIQYFVPLYQQMAKDPAFNLTVIYLSDETLKGYKDKEFGVEVKWDIPLLEGYTHLFLRNSSWHPSVKNGFFGLINLGLIGALRKFKKDTLVIVHGWSHFSLVLAVVAARIWGLRVGLRGETPLKHEHRTKSIKNFLRRLFLKSFLFQLVHEFFFIGEQNRAFYLAAGVTESNLHFTPYAVDNARFRAEYLQNLTHKVEWRKSLSIPDDGLVILFVGKYINKKRPLDLLNAVSKLERGRIFVVMVGDGALRDSMQNCANDSGLTPNVRLVGFANQTEVSKYYTIGDVFVMCSGFGETWGLAVNEAMNFNLPILISDLTGCSDDLVRQGENGYVFATGNTDEMAAYIGKFSLMSGNARAEFGKRSAEIVKEYSIQTIIANLKAFDAHVD